MNCPKCGYIIDPQKPEDLDVKNGKLIHKNCPQPVEEPILEIDYNQKSEETLVKVVQEKSLSNSIGFPPVEKEENLTKQQELNIAILSYGQAIAGKAFDPDVIHAAWPTDPSEEWRAGKRPSITAIRQYQATDAFRADMAKRGINVRENSELSVEQIALLSILTNPTDTRSLNAKLRSAGIKAATYRGWLRQRPFQDKLKEMASSVINESIPIAEAQLAAQASAGDLKAIKFMFEVTGRHDPARQQAVDTQALIGVIIDVMQETITDPELLAEIQQKIKFRAQGVKGVIR